MQYTICAIYSNLRMMGIISYGLMIIVTLFSTDTRIVYNGYIKPQGKHCMKFKL